MRFGVLGTGDVGIAIATKLIELGHEVMLGSRTPDQPDVESWVTHHRPASSAGTVQEAAAFGAIAFLCTSGAGAVATVTAAAPALAGKLVIDVTNPLDFSGGAPSLFVAVDDSLGERVQRAVPASYVVKALNTINHAVMVEPGAVPGDHVVFVAGNDDNAKADTVAVLGQFGWPPERVLDAGDITGARATEAYLLLWLRLARAGEGAFNIAVERA